MKLIPLSQGRFAMVDDRDFEELSELKWSCSGKKTRPYAAAYSDGEWLYMHRVVAKPEAGMFVDHRDGDTLNNQRSNLRCCQHRQNIRNSKISKRNKTGFKGVSFNTQKNRFVAHIKVNYRSKYLGYFNNARDAAAAYNRAAMKWFGAFSNLNVL